MTNDTYTYNICLKKKQPFHTFIIQRENYKRQQTMVSSRYLVGRYDTLLVALQVIITLNNTVASLFIRPWESIIRSLWFNSPQSTPIIITSFGWSKIHTHSLSDRKSDIWTNHRHQILTGAFHDWSKCYFLLCQWL